MVWGWWQEQAIRPEKPVGRERRAWGQELGATKGARTAESALALPVAEPV